MKQQLIAAAEHETATVADLKHDHELELRELRSDMMKAAEEYKNKVQHLESLNRDEINATNERHHRQLQVADVTCCNSCYCMCFTMLVNCMAKCLIGDYIRQDVT